ncbi:hypothetical protein ITP53_08390 [Nonomuraea sp. K274]|uniref:ABC-type branched-subunit amino acid transport system substrate-binding protein n=1 Tax=Nonomuraea cypriaca TaxID=1187855 RepID=A0A931A605_9ACTN|nr:hypothetical protein [Nonomuraea cypriaca]MBF8185758.1 hypothetical protein [Nonomuraea cypriaca]
MKHQLEQVLADLTYRDRFTRNRLRFRRGQGALMVQVEGDTELMLEWLRGVIRRYRGLVPVNNPSAVQDGLEPQLQVVEQLQTIAEGCGYGGRVARGLPIVFPRFATARTALYDWRPVAEHSHAQRISDLRGRIERAIAEERRHTLHKLRPRLKPLLDDPAVTQQLSGLPSLALKLINAFRMPERRTFRWYRTRRFRGQRTDESVCEVLYEWRRKPDHQKQLLLVEALLADIDAHYGLFRRLNHARHPMILLPEVDTIPARRIIRDRILEACDGESHDLRLHPLVISTAGPGAAAPARGAQAAVAPGDLAKEILHRYDAREAVANRRLRDHDDPLPSRLIQVRLDQAESPETTKPMDGRRRRIPGPLTAVITAAAVVVAGVVVERSLRGPEPCGTNLEIHEGDCVGVSDGAGVFMPAVPGMSEVFARIAEQNRAVAARRHATVALLIPLESGDPAVRRQILSEVQGAYLAQAQANGPDAARPSIRLVIANPGRDYRHWRFTVGRLVEQEPNLRVIAGFNLSLTTTKQALTYVTNTLRIPAVASVVTADDFANEEGAARLEFPGLARVVSTSKDQARALLNFDPTLAGKETALVADNRPGDNYNQSLRETFSAARQGRNPAAGVQDMLFESPGVESPGVTPNEFEDFAANICRSRAKVVYFAGRAFHLELFVKKLATTYCREKASYDVITGSDATTLDQRLDDAERALLRGDPRSGKPSVTIRYASPAHPDAWTTEVEKVKAGQPSLYLRESEDAMEALRLLIAEQAGTMGAVDLADGRTIVTHDVVLTASRALARAVHSSEQEVPTADRIRKDLGKLNSDLRVRGASGWICLTNAGNPYNKALFVVRLAPGAGELALEGAAWPTGRVPKNESDCVVPATP